MTIEPDDGTGTDIRPTTFGLTVRAEAVIPAPPAEIFAVLADPRRHPEFDGSGSVRSIIEGPEQLTAGAEFGMTMRRGVRYRVTNRVVEFEPDRRIAWCNLTKAVWTYTLEPADGGTRVTETWDATNAPLRWFFKMAGTAKQVAVDIPATLARLRTRFEVRAG